MPQSLLPLLVSVAELIEQGLQYHRNGQLGLAQSVYRRVLGAEPAHAETLYLLGMTHAQQGEFDAAISSFLRALDAQPGYFDALYNLGSAYTEAGDYARAVESLRAALATQPRHGGAHYALANALRACEQAEAAIASYRQAIQCQPHLVAAHNNLGNALVEAGDYAGAVESLRRASALAPDAWQIHASLAAALHTFGHLEEAAASCRRALALQSDILGLHANLAKVLWAQGKMDEARRSLECARLQMEDMRARTGNGTNGNGTRGRATHGAQSATSQGKRNGATSAANEHNEHNENVEALLTLGDAYQTLCEFRQAAACFRRVLAIAPHRADASNRLGLTCWTLGELTEAENCFRAALKLRPDFPGLLTRLSYVLSASERMDEAECAARQAISLAPADAEAHCCLGQMLLKRGDYAQAWTYYDYIHRMDISAPRRFPQPRWDGSDLTGKTILIHAQFGLGDTLQFARYLPLVKERGGRVLFECPWELASLLQNSAGFDQMLVRTPASGSRIPEAAFDVQFNLMSLPALFQSDDATIPAAFPYVHVDAERRERWHVPLQERLKAKAGEGSNETSNAEPSEHHAHLNANQSGKETENTEARKFIIGIVWAASTEGLRSCRAADFAPLAALPGVSLVSLQKGLEARQISELPSGMRLHDLAPDIRDFADTAAILTHLDLVITVDTSVAHLAGAMNIPVWTLLPFGADWRWQQNRADTPWYPSMRLFRQTRPGDWHSVFAQVLPALQQIIRPTHSLPDT